MSTQSDQHSPEDLAAAARRESRATRVAALSFGLSILAGLGLLAVYLQGGDTQVEGLLLAVAFTGVGVGLGVWVKEIIGHQLVTEPRHPMRSSDHDRAALEEEFDESVSGVGDRGRRRFLLRLLGGAGASLGLALSVPLLSLGPIFNRGAREELFETAWTAGARLVTPEGAFLTPADLEADQIATVFPADADTPADAQAVLIRLRSDRLVAQAMPLPDGVVDDSLVCYSKLCTHAGCPVGLFRASEAELICPCHQSLFDVNAGAAVKSGPAGRPLPQLPIGVDEDGFLIAMGDFTAPVGPSFWNLTDHEGA